jgi:hypothetical protein
MSVSALKVLFLFLSLGQSCVSSASWIGKEGTEQVHIFGFSEGYKPRQERMRMNEKLLAAS